MSWIAKFCLTSTALAPVLLVYSLVYLISGAFCIAALFVAVFIVPLLICLFLIRYLTRTIATQCYVTESVETADQEVVSFLLIYLLPLISGDLSSHSWAVGLIIALFYCVVMTTGYGYHFNPLLTIFRYRFYRVTEKHGLPHILITRRRIYAVGETLSVANLVDFILIEKADPTPASGHRTS